MQIRPGYILRQVVEIYVVIGTGADSYAPNEIMSLNETGAFLWRQLEQGAERDGLIDSLIQAYEVDSQTAARDVDAFLAQLREKALITP